MWYFSISDFSRKIDKVIIGLVTDFTSPIYIQNSTKIRFVSCREYRRIYGRM